MTAPARGSPLLSRTVPVMVANPLGVLADAGVALVAKESASAITGNVNPKSFFIAARPPEKLRGDIEQCAASKTQTNGLIETDLGNPFASILRVVSSDA